MPYLDKEKQKEYQNSWIQKRRLDWIEKNGPCKKCGSFIELTVHHTIPSLKKTHKIWSYTEEKRKEELKYCIVLCELCHKEETDKQRYSFKHGTTSGYDHYKCRCKECLDAKMISDNRIRKRGNKENLLKCKICQEEKLTKFIGPSELFECNSCLWKKSDIKIF